MAAARTTGSAPGRVLDGEVAVRDRAVLDDRRAVGPGTSASRRACRAPRTTCGRAPRRAGTPPRPQGTRRRGRQTAASVPASDRSSSTGWSAGSSAPGAVRQARARRTGRTTAGRGRTSASARARTRSSTAPVSAASEAASGGAETRPRASAPITSSHLEHALHEVEVGDALARGTGASPRARTATRVRPGTRTCGRRRRGPRASGDGSRKSTKKTAAVVEQEPEQRTRRPTAAGAPPG